MTVTGKSPFNFNFSRRLPRGHPLLSLVISVFNMRRIKQTEDARALEEETTSIGDEAEFLAIADIIQRLIDSRREFGPNDVSVAAGQFSVVSQICESMPLFNDASVSIPMYNVHAVYGRYKHHNMAAGRAREDVSRLRNIISTMSAIHRIIVLAFALTLPFALCRIVEIVYIIMDESDVNYPELQDAVIKISKYFCFLLLARNRSWRNNDTRATSKIHRTLLPPSLG